MSPIFLALILIAVIYYLPRLFRYFRELERKYRFSTKIPGPKGWPLFGNSLQIPLETHDWTPFFCKLANDHLAKGENVMRLWMMDTLKVIPLNGESMKYVLDSTEEITKSSDYDLVQPWLGTGLLIATGEKWRQRRKMLTPTFHFAMLDGYVSTFDSKSKLLTEILEEYAISGESVDMFPFVNRCALDVICETAMGFDLNCQVEKEHPYAIAVGEMGRISTIYAMRPWMWLTVVWYLGGWAKKFNDNLKVLTDFTKGVIARRRITLAEQSDDFNEGTKRKAFLDMLLEMEGTNKLTDEDIREEVDTFMFEGHDTTTSGISWILWCLATHQDIQERVYQEVIDVLGTDDRAITVEDIKSFEYLDRVLKEAMRINPPVPFVGRKLVNDMKIGEYTAPRGAEVLIAPLMVHRNEQVYPDVLKFDPDRFLPENSAKRNAYDYITFSAGPRNCIGQKFAIYEEKVMVAWIIRKYKLSSTMTFLENGRCPEVILRPQFGIPLKLERREH